MRIASQATRSKPPGPRVAFYTHDTVGLGHLTRTLRLIQSAVVRWPRLHCLLITGSPATDRFRLPSRTRVLNLPAVVKVGPGQYRPRKGDLSLAGLLEQRSSLINTAIESFDPGLFCVDTVPTGLCGELIPVFRGMRSRNQPTEAQLHLRDVLDEPGRLQAEWQKSGAFAAIESTYSRIRVFGDETVFPTVRAYGLPADKSDYLGYVTPASKPRVTPESGKRKVLIAVGGGEDGFEPSTLALRAVERLPAPVEVELLTGPLMPRDRRGELSRSCRALPNATVREFAPDYLSRLATADVVVSMGGYNTLAECVWLDKKVLVIPRTHPRREQLMRAESLANAGLARVFPLRTTTAGALAQALVEALESPREPPSRIPNLTGGLRFAEGVVDLLNTRAAS